jgi:hypothetical protein
VKKTKTITQVLAPAKKNDLTQDLRERKKILRTATRLRYSLAADRELSETLPLMEKAYWHEVQSSRMPSALDVKKILGPTK